MNLINKIKFMVRFSDWWNFIVPPILGWMYMAIFLSKTSLRISSIIAIYVLISIIGTAGYGFFLNNWTDIRTDEKSGKANFTSSLSIIQRIFLLAVLLALAMIPWVLITENYKIISIVLIQILLLTIYSTPPLRLKKNPYICLILDSLYSNVLFSLAVILAFLHLDYFTLAIISSFLFLRGFRNILIHQIQDRKFDKRSEIKTFVNKHGPVFSANFINRFILPVEIFLLIFLAFALSGYFPYLYLTLVLFLLFSISKYRYWEKLSLPKRHYKTMFHTILNDYYEEWLPIIFLIYLSINNIYFLIFIGIHLLIFPKIILKLITDCKNILRNFMSDFRHLLKLIKS